MQMYKTIFAFLTADAYIGRIPDKGAAAGAGG